MNNPRLVFSCDHYIKESYDETSSYTTTHNGMAYADEKYSSHDVLLRPKNFPPNNTITVTSSQITDIAQSNGDIQVFTTALKHYTEGIDYDISISFGEDGQYMFVNWIKGASAPEENAEYIVELQYTRIFTKQYSLTHCPRCCGDGWYVGIFEQGKVNSSLIQGENNIIQSFFKYIYTRKQADGYGSNMLNIPGRYNATQETELRAAIMSEIDNFETYYKELESSLLLDGYPLTDTERLRGTSLTNLEIIPQEHLVKVEVVFFTAAGGTLSVSLSASDE